jgi:hypothetical protein
MFIGRYKDMENAYDIPSNLTEQSIPAMAVDDSFIREAIREMLSQNKGIPFPPNVLFDIMQTLLYFSDDDAFRKVMNEELSNLQVTTIHFRIIEEPLTPQNLALAFTTLTELATKLWLVAKRRLSDLIEYTQTHDIRFADEAGSTIAWATYNSPFSFGFQVDKLVPSVADALMTVVNGLSQRKAHVEKLELDNQAAEQKIKEDEKKSELEQTKEQLAIERERVALLRETMEAQKQGIEYAIEITKTLVDITYPNADIETKGMIITTLLPGVLQLDNVRGLQLVLPETLPLGSKATLDNTEPQQDAGQ